MTVRSYHTICASPDRYIRMHSHDYDELVYYFNGEGRSRILGRRYDIHPGVFTLTPSGVFHDQENLTELQSFCILLKDFDIDGYAGSWRDYGGSIRRILFTLFSELEHKRPAYKIICSGLVHEMIGLAERIVVERTQFGGQTKSEIVQNAIDTIAEREGLITVGELSQSLNVSKDYLRHLFHECEEMSPQKHIIEAKLRKATRMLGDPGLTVSQIADSCGFSDVYYFSGLFKSKLEVSPTEYRRRLASGQPISLLGR